MSDPPAVVRVRVVHRSRWTRTLVLTGEVEANVAYKGIGSGERVYLDGKLWAETSVWCWQNVYPFVEFPLPGRNGDVPARIDVAGSFLPWKFGITRFRFSVAGETLYQEAGGECRFGGEPGFVTDEPFEADY